ncbi:MAG: hypothetical protein ACE5G9_04445 [Nitrospinales bacterium]
MRKVLAVAIAGILLLSVSAVSTVSADGSNDSSSDSSSDSKLRGDGSVDDNQDGDRRRGADKPEDDTMRISNTHNSGFEGIWILTGLGTNWVGMTVSGNKIILLKYQPGQLSSALAGSIVGSVASLGFATDASSFAATLTLTSSTTATIAVTSCTPKPGLTCSFPSGSNFALAKVFE